MVKKHFWILLAALAAVTSTLIIFIVSSANLKNIRITENNRNTLQKDIILTYTPVPAISPTNTPTPTPRYKTKSFFVTFYGWPDNTPAGNAIAFPRSRFDRAKHDFAAGAGTYQDPVTFASDPDHIPVGSIYYVPYVQKYIVMEDLCVGCVESWNLSNPHIDIWMESDDQFGGKLWQCQRKWTRNEIEVIIEPPSTLSVNRNPVFNKNTGSCM